MDYYDVKRFALILAVQAEIEGMKAENLNRQLAGCDGVFYLQDSFDAKANILNDLANKHNEQL